MEETIAKLNSFIKAVATLTDEDAEALLLARKRIEDIAGEDPSEQDKAGLTRIDSILAIYSTLPVAEE